MKQIKVLFNFLLWVSLWLCSAYYDTAIYLFHQSYGQVYILTHTQSFDEYIEENQVSEEQKRSLELIKEIKAYSYDNLHYKPTKNFTTIYDQKDAPVLWAITASEKYKIKAFYWKFPIVGSVSYKGFFNEQRAIVAKDHLVSLGYDVDLRPVSAW